MDRNYVKSIINSYLNDNTHLKHLLPQSVAHLIWLLGIQAREELLAQRLLLPHDGKTLSHFHLWTCHLAASAFRQSLTLDDVFDSGS